MADGATHKYVAVTAGIGMAAYVAMDQEQFCTDHVTCALRARTSQNHEADRRRYQDFICLCIADPICGLIGVTPESRNRPLWVMSTAAFSRKSEGGEKR